MQGKIIFQNNVIQNNYCKSKSGRAFGGGVFIKNCQPVLRNNLIYGNSAHLGGGITILHRPSCGGVTKPLLENVTICNNTALNGKGGGIFFQNASADIYNTIISLNDANSGHEIYLSDPFCDPNFYYSNIQSGIDDFEGQGTGNYYKGVFDECTIDVPVFSDKSGFLNKPETEDQALSFQLAEDDTTCIDRGHPEAEYQDLPEPGLSGIARFPSRGSVRNDIGVDGGPDALENETIGIKTSIHNTKKTKPLGYSLAQNYPNPFNPSTIITFTVPKSEFITIVVYNSLGQRIKDVLNEVKSTGTYQIEFDGADLPSGTYFYKITAGEFSQVRKMVLLK